MGGGMSRPRWSPPRTRRVIWGLAMAGLLLLAWRGWVDGDAQTALATLWSLCAS